MIILKSTFELLSRGISTTCFECGGILGSNKNEVIDNVVIDTVSHKSGKKCSYAPNVEFFNECILKWQNQSIRFLGIFHTHFMGVKTLSMADKKYIETIMTAMPEEVDYLYFPIFVLPQKEFSGYIARRNLGGIKILVDDVIIE